MPIPEPTFPKSERVKFKRNLLDLVVCELRFPPILRIEADIQEIQEKILNAYPNLSIQNNAPGPITIQVGGVEQFVPMHQEFQHKYRFSTDDGDWTIALANGSLALSTKRYKTWEEFQGRLDEIRRAFVDRYKIRFYSRVGLRYQDVINRKEWGLAETPWRDLLNPCIAGEFASEFGQLVEQITSRQILIGLKTHGKCFLRHGVGIGHRNRQQEEVYIFDSDFFTTQKEEDNNVGDILAYFNRESGNLFRWAIKGPLRDALEPEGFFEPPAHP